MKKGSIDPDEKHPKLAIENHVSPDTPRPWLKFTALSSVLAVVGIYFGAQILAGIVAGMGAAIFGGDQQKLEDLFEKPVGQFVFVLLFELITLAMVWVFLRLCAVDWRSIGLSRLPRWSDLKYSLIFFAAYFVTLLLVTGLVDALVPSIDTDQKQQILFDTASTNIELILAFLALVVMVPVVEEIMVRGFLYSGLLTRYSKVVAAVLASVIFGAAHLQLESGNSPLWIAAIDTCILSLFLIYAREKTGSLWTGMIVHAIKNGLAFAALFIFVTV